MQEQASYPPPLSVLRCFLIGLCARSLHFPALCAPGEIDLSFNPDAGGNSSPYVSNIALQPDGRIVVGGTFTSVGGVTRNGSARLAPGGALESGFNPNAIPTSIAGPRGTCLQSDGKILIAGNFFGVGGVVRERIAQLNGEGMLEPGFSPVVNGSVDCMAIDSNGSVVIGGYLQKVNGTARHGIARLRPDGTLDLNFDPNTGGPFPYVESVSMQTNDDVVIGGSFASVGGAAHRGIARIHADGTPDPSFNANVGGARPYVDCIALQADGKIVIGGEFTEVNGVARNRIARLHANGALDAGFNPDASDFAITLVVQTDGKILIGGGFTSLAGVSTPYLARLQSNGARDLTFNPSPTNSVLGMALQSDGRIILGGYFASVSGVARNRVARLHNDAVTQNLTVPNAGRVQWLRGGASPETQQVRFEFSADTGSAWTLLGTGVRIAGGWESAGLSIPASGQIRARARIVSGAANASSGLSETVTERFSFGTPLTTWKMAELGDADAADLGDEDFDGLTHLAEYALNLSPTTPSLPPPAALHLYAEGERLRMLFTRDPARHDVTLEVQSAESPAGPWTTVAASTLGSVTTGPGYVGGDDATPGLKTVEVRDTVNLSPTTASRYLRVKVMH